MLVKPLGKFTYQFREFEVGDKVEVLEGSDLSFFGIQVGDVFPLVSGYSGPKVLIKGVTYNGDKLVLRKVSTSKRKGLCDFLRKVERQYAHKE